MKYRNKLLAKGLLVLTISSLFISSPATAEDEPTTILITPNRLQSDPATVGSATSVIRSDEINAQKLNSVSEAIRTLPGVSVVATGNRGSVSSVFIRGAESDQVLVLIDGVRLNESTTGGFDFSDLSVDNVERIEILRGAQGVLYGSEAMGGVINIITKKPLDGTNVSGSLEGGSYATQRYAFRAGYGSEKISSSTELSFEDTEGRSVAATNRGNSEHDAFSLFSLNSRNSYRVSKDLEFIAGLGYLESDAELDGFDFESGPVDDLNYQQERKRLVLDAKVRAAVGEKGMATVATSYVDEELLGTDPDNPFNEFDIESELFTASAQFDLTLVEDATTSLGYVYERRSGENIGNFDEQRDVNALFIQQQLKLVGLYLSLGSRWEHDSEFGDEITYRATAALPFKETNTRIHSSLGTGFKAPSFNELAFPNFGNPDLDPETSVAFDIGVEQALGKIVKVDLTYFHSEYKDLITFDSETFIANNIDKANAQGVELALWLTPCDFFDANVNYTYTDSENEETGGVLARRPRHSAAVVLHSYPNDKIDATLRLRLVQSRRDTDGAKMDNYVTVDSTFSYKITERIKPYLKLINVFDEEYEEIPGFSTAGFSVYAGIDVKLL